MVTVVQRDVGGGARLCDGIGIGVRVSAVLGRRRDAPGARGNPRLRGVHPHHDVAVLLENPRRERGRHVGPAGEARSVLQVADLLLLRRVERAELDLVDLLAVRELVREEQILVRGVRRVGGGVVRRIERRGGVSRRGVYGGGRGVGPAVARRYGRIPTGVLAERDRVVVTRATGEPERAEERERREGGERSERYSNLAHEASKAPACPPATRRNRPSNRRQRRGDYLGTARGPVSGLPDCPPPGPSQAWRAQWICPSSSPVTVAGAAPDLHRLPMCSRPLRRGSREHDHARAALRSAECATGHRERCRTRWRVRASTAEPGAHPIEEDIRERRLPHRPQLLRLVALTRVARLSSRPKRLARLVGDDEVDLLLLELAARVRHERAAGLRLDGEPHEHRPLPVRAFAPTSASRSGFFTSSIDARSLALLDLRRADVGRADGPPRPRPSRARRRPRDPARSRRQRPRASRARCARRRAARPRGVGRSTGPRDERHAAPRAPRPARRARTPSCRSNGCRESAPGPRPRASAPP